MRPHLCPNLWNLFKSFDLKNALEVKKQGCSFCGGILDGASFPRKPRGIKGLGLEAKPERRLSFCCRSCRKRTTPSSACYLWKKVYVLMVVTLEPVKGWYHCDRRTRVRWSQYWKDNLSVPSPFIRFIRHKLPIEFNFSLKSLVNCFTIHTNLNFVGLARLLSPLGCAFWLRFKESRAEDAY